MQAFVEEVKGECVWGQVLVEGGNSFRLRHLSDRAADLASLKAVTIPELRKIATFNSAGEFRPLHAAPDLPPGWICSCKTAEELWRALQELYPGSVADWFAVRNGAPPVTGYREFTNRQSGMYRITQSLSDTAAAQVVRSCCPARLCLKSRFWTAEGLPPDVVGRGDGTTAKSTIPCLEPCAILLELARKAARIYQEKEISVSLAPSDWESFMLAARTLLEGVRSGQGAGNLGSPINPRRLQLVLEKFGGKVDTAKTSEDE